MQTSKQLLTDIYNKLVSIDEKFDKIKEKNNEDYWHPALGTHGGAPSKDCTCDWVFVKIRALGKDMEPIGEIFPEPHIAKFTKYGWVRQSQGCYDTCDVYETLNFPYQVVYWRPIPLDYLFITEKELRGNG